MKYNYYTPIVLGFILLCLAANTMRILHWPFAHLLLLSGALGAVVCFILVLAYRKNYR